MATVIRFRKASPCPICQGYEELPHGKGQRCYGFLSADGDYAHCTREEYAGALTPDPNGETYAHRLKGRCKCGVTHLAAPHDPSPSANGHQRKTLVATYDYQDANGHTVHRTVRYRNPKDFRQCHPDGHGGWIWNLKGVRTVLYRLPELCAADPALPVYVVEGEKDVEQLRALGLVATCNPMGAKKWKASYSQALKGRHVIILPDNDPDGQAHAALVAQHTRPVAASVRMLKLPHLPAHGDVSDWLQAGHTVDDLLALVAAPEEDEPPPIDEDEALYGESETMASKPQRPQWHALLSQTKRSHEVKETLRNVTLALQHLEPWASGCWYDAVRDIFMVGDQELNDHMVIRAGLAIEEETGMPVRSTKRIANALAYLCVEHPRDLLSEWINALPPWDGTPRLETWLITYAHAPDSHILLSDQRLTSDPYTQGTERDYSHDVSRLLIESLVARAIDPGCQYRYVVILEGNENAGKTKLVEAIASPEWYRELSHGLDGKEAHMRIKRAWVAELAELASFGKTEESRLKSFFTLREDIYVPKFANFEVKHKRRAVFIGTVNPEGGNDYMRSQTGNTRYLPIPVRDIHVEGFEAVRTQIFAEALQHYRADPANWWKLSAAGSDVAQLMREDRRQRSVYEDDLGSWLEHTDRKVTWVEEILTQHLKIPTDRWNRNIQMEVTKALKALGWEKGPRERVFSDGQSRRVVPWRPGDTWRTQE